MQKLATTVMDQAQTSLAGESSSALPLLLATGGLGAATGALLTGDSNDPNETTGQRVRRRIRNALIGGGLAAGATGLARYGLDKANTALPAPDTDPVTKAWYSPLTRAVGAGVGAGAGSRIGKRVGSNRAAAILESLGVLNSTDPTSTLRNKVSVLGKDPTALKNLTSNYRTNNAMIHDLTQAGINTKDIGKGSTKKLLNSLNVKGFGAVKDTQALLGREGSKLNKFTKILRPMGGRALARNKVTALATLAGAFAPEIASGTASAIGALLPDSDPIPKN